jgi:iron complex outermembrane receptor protein
LKENVVARLHPIAGACALLCALAAQAQDPTLRPITVTPTQQAPAADVTGFGDFPRREVPVSTSIVTHEQIESSGARRLADLTRFEGSVSDAYNAPGYWDFLSIRGFILDNRFNYRREGLPINAETSIPLDNKERVEILKGTSGIQAGTSAPGGLVNYVVKRPTERDVRVVRLEARERGSVLAAADLGGRFGNDAAFGWRFNVAQERLRPEVRALDGERSLVALATDWRVSRDSLLEGEFEWSSKHQPSQTGFSLLGSTLPAVPDPRINLNNQPWVQPTQFDGLTGTLRFSQALSPDWRWTAQLGTQRLRTDDYTAFPFGCAAEGLFDRFCSDGTFDYWDFRSENERRRQDAASVGLKGRVMTGAIAHDLSVGILRSRVRNRFGEQAFNPTGVGDISGTAVVAPAPLPTFPSTNRDEHSTELSLSDAIQWTPAFTTWVGARHTRLERGTVSTDGSNADSFSQSVTTPWLGATYKFGDSLLAYASWGRGIESQQVPNNFIFANQGVVLPALKSEQVEIGLRGGQGPLRWEVAAFNIERPMTNIDFCNRGGGPCVGEFDGDARHRGVEAGAQWDQGPWQLWGSLMLLDAERRGSTTEPALNGLPPLNVPDRVLRAGATYRFAAVPGLSLAGSVSHEGRRAVVPDNSIELPSWTRLDAALRYEQRLYGAQATWIVGVDNLTDRRYWRESPTQFGHIYLYPGAPRTFRVSLTTAF